MSVYIEGMDMPKCCAECVALHDDGNSLTCLITHEPRGYMFPDTEERMSNCPLIPVPKHGRLIDADKLFRCFPELRPYDFAPTIIPADKEEQT